jgi:hypothetical protein
VSVIKVAGLVNESSNSQNDAWQEIVEANVSSDMTQKCRAIVDLVGHACA